MKRRKAVDVQDGGGCHRRQRQSVWTRVGANMVGQVAQKLMDKLTSTSAKAEEIGLPDITQLLWFSSRVSNHCDDRMNDSGIGRHGDNRVSHFVEFKVLNRLVHLRRAEQSQT